MEIDTPDSQKLLADLAAEYERSTRFLQQLESCLTREPVDEPLASTASDQPYIITTPDGEEAPAPGLPDNNEPPSPPSPIEPVPPEDNPPESTPGKLRAKLRSLFARRVTVREEAQQQKVQAQQAQAQAQAQASAQPKPPSTQHAATRPVEPSAPRKDRIPSCTGGPALARSVSGRRQSMLQFSTEPSSRTGGRASLDLPDRAERPVTGRRASVVYFGGTLLDGPGNGAADLRLGALGTSACWAAGNDPVDASPPQPTAPRRPSTGAPRRASYTTYSTNTVAAAAAAAAETAEAAEAAEAPCRSGTPGLPVTEAESDRHGNGSGGRRASVVHFVGGILDSDDPHDCVPRRSVSFYQLRAPPGAALQPTGARVRAAAVTGPRRVSVDVLQSNQGPPSLNGTTGSPVSAGAGRIAPDSPQPPAQQHPQQQQQQTPTGGHGDSSQRLMSGRRASLEAARSQLARTAVTASAALSGAPGCGGSSSYSGTEYVDGSASQHLVSGVPTLPPSLQQQQQLLPTAAEGRVSGQLQQLRLQTVSSPPPLQPPAVGQAWSAAASPLNSPGSLPVSPADAGAVSHLQAYRLLNRAAAGDPRRAALSGSNSWLRRSGLTNEEFGIGSNALTPTGNVQGREQNDGLPYPMVITAAARAASGGDFGPVSGGGRSSPGGASDHIETPMRSRCKLQCHSQTQLLSQSQYAGAPATPATPPPQTHQQCQHQQQHQQQQQRAFVRVGSLGASLTSGAGPREGTRSRRSSALLYGT